MSTTDRIDLLLKLAVLSGSSVAVKIRLRQKPNLNARDNGGRTILMLAAAKGNAQVCSLLIDAGADLLAIDHANRTAISIAREAGFASLATVLEERRVHHRNNSLTDQYLVEPELTPSFDPVTTIETCDWEADEGTSTPISDDSCINAVAGYQLGISQFAPVDTAKDWEDVRIKLPTHTHRRRRKVRFEKHQRNRIHNLFRDGILNGCIPFWKIEETVLAINGEHDDVLQSHLLVVLDDLGVGVEDHDYWNWYAPFPRTKLSREEKHLLRSAKRHFRDLVTPRLDPLELWYRDASVNRLLTHGEEIELGKAKDNAFENAIRFAAQSEPAIAEILEAEKLVVIGKIPLKSASIPNGALENGAFDAKEDIASKNSSQSGLPSSDRAKAIDDLSELLNNSKNRVTAGPIAKSQEIRNLLLSLHPSWNFIVNVSKKLRSEDCSPEPISLYTAVLEGNNARGRLAASNLRLVASIAKTFWHHGFPILDLIQEGSIGLLRAVDKYDHHLGFRFSTYATWWIRQFMQRAICDQSRLIRLPYHVVTLARQCNRIITKLGCRTDTNEIASYLNVPTESIQRAIQATREIHRLVDLGDGTDTNFDEPQCETASPLDLLIQKCLCADIRSLLLELAPRDREVLSLRFGLHGEREQTLEEVGSLFGVTRERIRQIEKRALRKLSELSSTRKMQDYLENYTHLEDSAQDTEGGISDAS